MSAPLRVVVLGNSFASRVQLPALRWAGGNVVVGLAGRDARKAERTAREWGIERSSGDWREILALEPELVLVATPVDLHREMTLAALETGAAVLCEKPFALNAAEAKEMAERSRGRGAWVDHELRWSPCVRRLRTLLDQGTVGEVWLGSVAMHYAPRAFRERPHGWWFEAARGGGALGALGSHLVDLVRFLLGEIEAVRCDLTTHVAERADAGGRLRAVTADDAARCTLRMEGGAHVEVSTSLVVPREPGFEILITGSAGALRLVDGEALSFLPLGEPAEPVPVAELPAASVYGMNDQGLFARSLPLFLRDVLRTVRAGGTDLPAAATFADGLAIQLVLDAAHRSAAGEGGWVPCRTAET